jgi:hypothetical protein
MKFTTAAITIASAFLTNASPLILSPRATCDVAPTGPAGNPIAQPSVTTAALCQAQCIANTVCQSFGFGLPPAESAPRCILFAVPAAQVSRQGENINVFDRGCGTAAVPTGAPTRDQPQGPANGNGNGSGNQNAGGSNAGASGQTGGNNSNNGNGARQGGPTGGGGNGNETPKKRDVCGAPPAGPAANAATQFQTAPVQTATTQAACLSLCRATTGCKS